MDDTNAQPSSDPASLRSRAIRATVQAALALGCLTLIVAVVFLGVLAGRPDWVMGWVFVAWFFFVCPLITCIVLIPIQPEMVLDIVRQKPVRSWDKALDPLLSHSWLVVCVPAMLDARFGWSPPVRLEVQLAALAVVVLADAGVIWAKASNRFFSNIACVQKDRGHAVATGGPYRIVRHPQYAAESVVALAVPWMLGSLWSLIPAGIAVALLVVYTAFEDRMLHEELDGYREYARRVRYRLVPGVW